MLCSWQKRFVEGSFEAEDLDNSCVVRPSESLSVD